MQCGPDWSNRMCRPVYSPPMTIVNDHLHVVGHEPRTRRGVVRQAG